MGTAAEPCLTTAKGLPLHREWGAGFVMLLSCITPAEVSIAAGVCALEAGKMGVPAPFRALLTVVC
jgi:hypothetical protein